MKQIDLAILRRYAVARSLVQHATLPKALKHIGFVQADPIRAPARAQDLSLRLRVKGYRSGDLETRYPKLKVEEDFFVNYGFVTPELQRLMHPRQPRTVWPKAKWSKANALLDFVREHGVVHPREVEAHFQHGKTRNWFGGASNVSTQLLDSMHYRGLLRVARREGGTRCYALRPEHPAAPDAAAAMDAMVDVLVGKYAPLPAASLSQLVMFLSAAAPQWTDLRKAALARAKARLGQTSLDGITWYWPAAENPASKRFAADDRVALLAPFDPVVWDRRRFELLWGWPYRFEAYTPAPKRVRGYYALPLLWRDEVVGWGNLAWDGQTLTPQLGYTSSRAPRDAGYAAALDEELGRLQTFLQPR